MTRTLQHRSQGNYPQLAPHHSCTCRSVLHIKHWRAVATFALNGCIHDPQRQLQKSKCAAQACIGLELEEHVPVLSEPAIKYMAKPFLLSLVLVQEVLKRPHHPLLKNVMLRHATLFSHKLLHSLRLETGPEACSKYTSPAFMSHAVFGPISLHVGFTFSGCVINVRKWVSTCVWIRMAI